MDLVGGLRRVGRVLVVAAVEPAVLRQGLHVELVPQERAELPPDLGGAVDVRLPGLPQAPTPALAVGLRGLPRLGQLVVDRRPVGVRRCALPRLVAVSAPPLAVVGELGEVGEVLEAPRARVPVPSHHRAGRLHVHVGLLGLRRVGLDEELHRLVEELHRADVVALPGVDEPGLAPARVAAAELAGDDVAVRLAVVLELVRGRGEQPPLRRVCGDGVLGELIELLDGPEVPHRLDGLVVVVGDVLRAGRGVEDERAPALERLLPVPLLHLALEPRTIRGRIVRHKIVERGGADQGGHEADESRLLATHVEPPR